MRSPIPNADNDQAPRLMENAWPLIVTVGLSGICVLADYFLKRVSAEPQPFRSWLFGAALLLEASTAFGWVYVMRHVKLATLGAIYSVSIVLLLAALGVFVFRETLTVRELIGIAFALASLVLLTRLI